MEQIKMLYDILTRDSYISQKDFLNLYPEDVPRNEAIAEILEMEREGLVKCTTHGKDIVYYLSDVVFH